MSGLALDGIIDTTLEKCPENNNPHFVPWYIRVLRLQDQDHLRNISTPFVTAKTLKTDSYSV